MFRFKIFFRNVTRNIYFQIFCIYTVYTWRYTIFQIYMDIDMYAYIYICIYIHTHAYICVYTVYIYIYLSIYICIFTVCICMYILCIYFICLFFIFTYKLEIRTLYSRAKWPSLNVRPRWLGYIYRICLGPVPQ